MRKLTIVLGVILTALAALAVAPDALLASYGALAHAILPQAIAGFAVLLLLVILLDRRVPGPPLRADAQAPASQPAPLLENRHDAEVINLLAMLQERGRLVDFLMDDVTGYSDAQVGAAARVMHEGCKAALLEHFGIKPMREESEGAKVTIPTEYAPDEYRLVGKIAGQPPFTGTLVHHGWRAEWVKLPRLLRTGSDRHPAVAPAEVELS
jgi:hypothetical protein